MGRVASELLTSAWRQRLARQRRSHLSVAEFCSREGVSSKSFYAWRKRLRAENPLAASSSLFVPVELTADSGPAGGVRIELPGGVVMTLAETATSD